MKNEVDAQPGTEQSQPSPRPGKGRTKAKTFFIPGVTNQLAKLLDLARIHRCVAVASEDDRDLRASDLRAESAIIGVIQRKIVVRPSNVHVQELHLATLDEDIGHVAGEIGA